MSAKKPPRLLITLSEETKEALAELSEKTGAPMAELVRRAIDDLLAKNKIR